MAFKINNIEFDYPSNFVMKRVDNIVNSFQTLSGRTVGDIRGWKYASNSMKWGYLSTEKINTLLSETNSEFTITFNDIDGTEHTINAIRISNIANNVFRVINGSPSFTDIEMGVQYPDVYGIN